MKVFAHNAFAAALFLGAAACVSPAQALVCPLPPYRQDAIPLDQVSQAASAHAKARIAEVQTIFRGHVVSAEYAPFRDRGGVYIITYAVSEWLKGRGGSYAKIVWYPGIPCAENCPIERTIRSLEANKSEAVFFADPLTNHVRSQIAPTDRLDGEDRPCSEPRAIQMAMEPVPHRSDRTYHDVVFRNALRAELKKFETNTSKPSP